MAETYQVVFETAVYRTVYVTADDADEAQAKAIDHNYPESLYLPNGYELNDVWFVDSVSRVNDDA